MARFRKDIRSNREQSYTNKKIALLIDSISDLLGGAAGGTPITIIQEEGVNVAVARAILNFVGAGVTAADDGSDSTDVTIPGYSDEEAQDAIGAMVDAADLTYNDGTPLLGLASIIAAAGPIGSATVVPIITYDAKGRLTVVTSAIIIPAQVAVLDTTDSTCFVALFESATGDLAPKTDGGLIYDASTGTLTPTAIFMASTTKITFNSSNNWIQGTASGELLVRGFGILRLASDIIRIRDAGNTITITQFEPVASGVNYLLFQPAATGAPSTLPVTATGTDTDININLVPKGTGRLQSAGVNVPTISSTDTLTNKTLTAPTIADFTNANHDHLDADDGGVLSLPAVGVANSSTVGQVLRVTGASTYAFGAVDLADTDAITGDLPFGNLTQGSALSVLGVTGNATADNASIAAASDHQVLRRSGTAVAFGAVNLAQGAAVTGLLPQANIAKTGTVIANLIERCPPATLMALDAVVAGASTPAESFSVLKFDSAVTWYMDYKCWLSPQYLGGGLTITLKVGAASASNNLKFEGALRRIEDSDDLDTTAHTYVYTASADTAAPVTIGKTINMTITITHGTNMDNVAAGEFFIFRLKRTFPASSTPADAYLYGLSIRET